MTAPRARGRPGNFITIGRNSANSNTITDID